MPKKHKAQAVADRGGVIPQTDGEDGAIDPEVLKTLDTVDLTLPDAFQDEAMGAELLEHITNYHRAMVANKSARHTGDQGQAEKMYRLAQSSRLAAALILSERPRAKGVADEIARFRALRTRMDRQAALAEGGKDGD